MKNSLINPHTIYVKARCKYKTKKGRCGNITVHTHPYCHVHTLLTTGLYIAQSGIPNAGLGLYTDKVIKKGTTILEYKGERIDTKIYNKRYEDQGYGAYGMAVNRKMVIDARRTSSGLARYVCDYTGSGKKPNTQYEGTKDRVDVVALRNIKRGEELIIDYGKEIRKAMGIEK